MRGSGISCHSNAGGAESLPNTGCCRPRVHRRCDRGRRWICRISLYRSELGLVISAVDAPAERFASQVLVGDRHVGDTVLRRWDMVAVPGRQIAQELRRSYRIEIKELP
jgi:hypothetical protein